jgi:hypothetical protein
LLIEGRQIYSEAEDGVIDLSLEDEKAVIYLVLADTLMDKLYYPVHLVEAIADLCHIEDRGDILTLGKILDQHDDDLIQAIMDVHVERRRRDGYQSLGQLFFIRMI